VGEFFVLLLAVLECIHLILIIIEKCIALKEQYKKKKGKRKTPSHACQQTDGVDSEESES
jgi:hypothetical protein